MMELPVASRTCRDQEGKPRIFHYALMVEQIELDSFCCENYGVHIWEEDGDSARIPGITTSAMRIDELMTLLVDNRVGPAGLPDVMADFL